MRVLITTRGLHRQDWITLAIAEELKLRKCKLFVITSYENSPLARMSDIMLRTSPLNSDVVAEAFSSNIASSTFINILYVEIMKIKGTIGINALNAMRETIAKRRH